MHDLLWGLGLFLIFEGLAYVLALVRLNRCWRYWHLFQSKNADLLGFALF